MNTKVIRVGIFDQIVSGGGVRLFTTKLLEEFSKLAGDKWRFHLMWPLFDSSNNFLPQPALPHTTFERISINPASRVHNNLVPRLYKSTHNGKSGVESAGLTGTGLEEYERAARENEQGNLRSGEGQGLRWLDERISGFNLIFFPYPYLTLPRGRVEWQPSTPVVTTLHDLAHEQTDAWGEMTEPLRKEVKRWTQISSLVIFSSDYIQREAQKIYGLPEERAKRIYLAPSEELETCEKPCDVLSHYGLKKEYILTLGWAAKHKRVETIVEGFALFKKISKRDIALVIAGPRTEELLSQSSYGLEVGRDLFALGYVKEEEIPALYRHCSLVVTASISEAGLNAMIFDAMKYERAIVCSHIPQFIERLGTDDSLALTFDPYSPQSLAEALCEHFSNPLRAASRIDRAKKFIAERPLSVVGKEYLEAFESVL
jgi:glycosyltransferase involved in cell wall biosynthesis